jgi:adenylate cyclase class IV
MPSVDEVELKCVVADEAASRARLEAAGGRLVEEGRLVDLRYDLPGYPLASRDEVLRVRAFDAFDAFDASGGAAARRASIDWKGPAHYDGGYKVRQELSVAFGDADTLDAILRRAGFVVTREIEREVAVYRLSGAVVRFERYPRMDVLVEVEGAPDAIERAIVATGLPREGFSVARLADFAAAYERRTGERAALCARELDGAVPYRAEDA